MTSFTVSNMALTIKTQLIQPIYKQFEQDLSNFENFDKRRTAGQIKTGEIFRYNADLRDFDAPPLPIKILNNILFNKVTSTNRSLSAVAFLDASNSGLKRMLEKRRNLIEVFREPRTDKTEEAYLYFGLKMENGNTYSEYADSLHGIMEYVDDIIFFSQIICEDLIATD
ncbi:MAG: hypothetical protein COA34_012900 [Methylophaga sp.]|uniref:hypothetical protein n=1 Tax=unclassified Methylophaga TaxID=2629249 RepID=UPI000C0D4F62|nr:MULTISPECIES: hypothetical protein [unclassified Methylophaga]MBL1458733.1 hypothetical protein [Methylophaga sp.]